MTSRTPSLRTLPSRLSILEHNDHQSRRSSFGPDEDAFAEDNGPDSPISIDNAPLGHFPPPRQQFPEQIQPNSDVRLSLTSASTPNLSSPSQLQQVSSEPQPQPQIHNVTQNQTPSTKQRLMIDDVPTGSGQGLDRSLSTSSRITIPRSQSPYTGPSAPSHPYSMYPQMTRASSIASISTFRAGSETPFVATAGPQHPYAMYPQNTVTEETEDITAHGIPLGFPRTNFAGSSAGASSADHGDIIGSDGHVEQLPPYTRYADNTVAKGNMDDINNIPRRRSDGPSSSQSQHTSETRSTDAVTNAAAEASDGEAGLLRPTELFEEETAEQRARKEGYRPNWKDTLKRPTFAGMPLWGLLVVVIIVIMSGIIGGVVGGIIGDRQGAQRAYANAATTTIWLDAEPTTLGPGSTPPPTGHYQIPFNQTAEVNDCIAQKAQFGASWGCMDIAYIGINVFLDLASGSYQAAFEDFSVNTADFKYGPQPPDFNGTAFTLQPMVDKDQQDLGIAMFFSVLFDKIIIIPNNVLAPLPPQRREDTLSNIARRSPAPWDGDPLEAGDRPWFCFWNSTISEFFVYLDEDVTRANASSAPQKLQRTGSTTTTPSTITAPPTQSTSAIMMPDRTTTPPSGSQLTSMTATTTTTTLASFAQYNPVYNSNVQTTRSPISPVKRSYESAGSGISNYPKLVKMVEKRKPSDDNVVHVQPYCQMMQVLDDWSIVPIDTVPPVKLVELQYPTSTMEAYQTSPNRKFKRGRDVVGDLESYCICEWTSQ